MILSGSMFECDTEFDTPDYFDRDDSLSLFRDEFLPVNYDSDTPFQELLESVCPRIPFTENSIPESDHSIQFQNIPISVLQSQDSHYTSSEFQYNPNTSVSEANIYLNLTENPSVRFQDSDDEIMEKLGTCRKFGGYPHENASIFLREFQSYAVLHKIDPADDCRILAAFHLNLTGPALTWFNSLQSECKRTWKNFLKQFHAHYIDLDWQHPTVFLESEIFHNMKLTKGQVLEDFYGQIVEKAQILKKEDHEILSQFIKGLPEKLAFFVRAGSHKDSASALAAAKMGEAYGYRNDENTLLVAAAKPIASSEPKESWAKDLQKQVQDLTQVVSTLQLQTKPRAASQQQKQSFVSQQQPRSPMLCYKCHAPRHISKFCNWNGQGRIDAKFQCQLCNQFGHTAMQCCQYNNFQNNSQESVHNIQCQICSQFGHTASQCSRQFQSGNTKCPGVTGHAPSGK